MADDNVRAARLKFLTPRGEPVRVARADCWSCGDKLGWLHSEGGRWGLDSRDYTPDEHGVERPSDYIRRRRRAAERRISQGVGTPSDHVRARENEWSRAAEWEGESMWYLEEGSPPSQDDLTPLPVRRECLQCGKENRIEIS